MSSYESLMSSYKFSTAKLRNNFDFSKLLAFIFTIWCLFPLFFYRLTHVRNRNEVFSSGFISHFNFSYFSYFSFQGAIMGCLKNEKHDMCKRKKASSHRRESFLVIISCVSITVSFFHQGYNPLPYPMRPLLAGIVSSRPKLANRSSHASDSSLSPWHLLCLRCCESASGSICRDRWAAP